MTTDTSKITGAADDLSDKLTKGGSAAKTLGAEIANAIKSLDSRVAALEAGGGSNPIPPDPVPPSGEIVIPQGPITEFTAANGGYLKIGGVPYHVETPGKSWNLQLVDDRTLRFEIRSGDRFSSSYWTDPTTSERCEVGNDSQALVPPAGTALLQHRIMWEAGPETTSPWSCYSQMHEKDVSNSPPYTIELQNDKMEINIGYDTEKFVYKDTNKIQRGKWYTIQSEIKWDRSNGFLRVKRDGVQIVDYTGPLGTGAAHYPKFGIYRSEANETVAVQYRDWSLKIT